MSLRLRPGATLQIGGQPLIVGSVVGEGSQGRVWELVDGDGRSVAALKWYHEQAASAERRRHLEWLIAGAPPSESFVWPDQLVPAGDDAGLGYTMTLLTSRWRPVSELVDLTPELRLAIARRLAEGLARLHGHGLCHRDLSTTNVRADPATGHIRIIDNDTAGTPLHPTFGVRGTAATTLAAVHAGTRRPDMANDRFALAVLLRRLIGPLAHRGTELAELLERTDPEAGGPEPVSWVMAIDDGATG